MIRIYPDDATLEELRTMRREALPAKVRDRIEMLTLADSGRSAPGIVGHCGQIVRDPFKGLLDRGTEALAPRRSGPAPDMARSDRVAEELRGSLAEGRIWPSVNGAEDGRHPGGGDGVALLIGNRRACERENQGGPSFAPSSVQPLGPAECRPFRAPWAAHLVRRTRFQSRRPTSATVRSGTGSVGFGGTSHPEASHSLMTRSYSH